MYKLAKISNLKRFAISKAKKNFCCVLEKYPDQILSDLKQNIHDEEAVERIEEDIISNINFFDNDQFTDIVCLLADNDKGSTLLWSTLNIGCFDHTFNCLQVEQLLDSCFKSNKENDLIINMGMRYKFDDLTPKEERDVLNQMI